MKSLFWLMITGVFTSICVYYISPATYAFAAAYGAVMSAGIFIFLLLKGE